MHYDVGHDFSLWIVIVEFVRQTVALLIKLTNPVYSCLFVYGRCRSIWFTLVRNISNGNF